MPQIWMTYEELASMLDCSVAEARERAHLTVGRVRPGSGPPRRGSSTNERGRPGPPPDREVDVGQAGA